MRWWVLPVALAAVGLTMPALLMAALLGIVRLARGFDPASLLYIIVFLGFGVLVG